MKALRFLSCLILLMPVFCFAEIYPDVHAPLDYKLPGNPCRTKPSSFESSGEAIGQPAQASDSLNVFEGSAAEEMSDVDSCTSKRHKRKLARWQKCTSKYKDALLGDVEELKANAKHGLN
jgi:hypothetical protein